VACGHSSLATAPVSAEVSSAYSDAVDPVSLREEAGQLATADRALVRIEKVVTRGAVVDVGCWTGSFLVAARTRGWQTFGVEPSRWASARARERGLEVLTAELADAHLRDGAFDLVALCDVLEHLAEPAVAIEHVGRLLRRGGGLYVTVPDAGSMVARGMGRHWWSVLPMHLQYFDRSTLTGMLTRHGFVVRFVLTHPKTFTARYYAARLGGFVHPRLAGAAERLTERIGVADRLVAPDFRDRLQVLATLG
jgi:SAM-dependent methyltransferase